MSTTTTLPAGCNLICLLVDIIRFQGTDAKMQVVEVKDSQRQSIHKPSLIITYLRYCSNDCIVGHIPIHCHFGVINEETLRFVGNLCANTQDTVTCFLPIVRSNASGIFVLEVHSPPMWSRELDQLSHTSQVSPLSRRDSSETFTLGRHPVHQVCCSVQLMLMATRAGGTPADDVSRS